MNHTAIGKRMELWTDDNLSEFAIKFNSGVVVKTSENTNLVKLIDECPYEAGFDFDWYHTLSQWVIYYLSNKYAASLVSKSKVNERGLKIQQNEVDSSLPIYVHDIKPRLRYKRVPKRGLQCHFCNLKYCLEHERKAHEEFWHHNKLVKAR
jgi:hypothetical protein